MQRGIQENKKKLTFYKPAQAIILLFLLSLFLITFITSAAADDDSAFKEDPFAGMDVLGMLSKLPSVLPFILARIPSAECKSQLKTFQEEIRPGSKEAAKTTLSAIKQAVCKVPMDCLQEVLNAVKQVVSNGGMIEKVVKGVLDKQGMDLETAELAVAAYVDSLCGSLSADEL